LIEPCGPDGADVGFDHFLVSVSWDTRIGNCASEVLSFVLG
jgi:hypothetical protein